MECGQIQKIIPAYLDGMDSPEERAFIEKHLTSCVPCRKALEEYQKARELVRGLDEVEPPPGFAQRIMAQVQEEGQKGGILKKLFYPLYIKVPIEAVATIVIAVLAIQVYRSVEPQKAAVHQYGVTVPAAPKEEPRKEDKQEVIIPPPSKSPRAEIRGSEEPKKKVETSHAEEKAPLAPPPIAAGATASREAEKAEAPPAQKRARMQPQAVAPSPKLETDALRKTESLTLTLRADDPAAAGEAAEAVLRELGGEKIERSFSGGAEIVTADLQAQRVKVLLERLKSFSEEKEKDKAAEASGGIVALRIEIRPR